MEQAIDRAHTILDFIFDTISRVGYQPSLREMAAHAGIFNKTITRELNKLEESGVISLTGNDRAICIPGVKWKETREIEWKLVEGEALILNILRDFLSEHGYQPSVNEIAELSGVSRVTVMKRIQKLHDAGVVYNTGTGRAIRLNGSRWIPHQHINKS